MSADRLFVAFLIFCFVVNAEAGIPFFSKTASWDEDVLLADGQLLSVHRTATFGPDEWGRSARGRLKEQTIRFSHNGQKIKWENDDNWPIMPDILDFANGMPVLVMPVQSWGPCYKYNFPPEGLVAFGYRNGRWARVATAKLPKELKVNLLRSTNAIKYWQEYKGNRITPADKVKLESGGWDSTKQGQTIFEASNFFADYEDSCVRMRPLPNKQLEETRQRNANAERNAPTIQAEVLSVITTPELVTKEMFHDQKGLSTGVGYLTESCKGIVEKIEPLQQWSGNEKDSRSVLAGYQLLLSDSSNSKKKVQIDEASRAQMQCVVCNQSTIFVVRRQDKESLIVHRFSHSGDLVDAFRISLPDTAKVVPGSDWGTLWAVASDAKGYLAMSVVDYTYSSPANLGGTIKRRINYAIRPPPK